jgi:hypothetical protein
LAAVQQAVFLLSHNFEYDQFIAPLMLGGRGAKRLVICFNRWEPILAAVF